MTRIADIARAGRARFSRQMACTRIHDLLASHAVAVGTAEAAVDGDIRLSYAALSDQVDNIAKALIAQGVAPGDRVATLAPSSLDFWVTMLAATSIGAVWMGLNPRYQGPEYAYLLDDATPRLVFARDRYDERDYLDELQQLGPHGATFVALGVACGRALAFADFVESGCCVSDADLAARRAAIEPEDIAIIVYTSGTTGKPKGAMLSHRAVMAAALTNLSWMQDGLKSTLNVAPTNHVGAINNVCMNVLAYGGKIVFHDRVDLEAIAALTEREQLTYLVGSPTAFAMFAAMPEPGLQRLGNCKLIVFGGGSTAEALLKPVAGLGIPMSTVYGQTETCGIVTASDFDATTAVMAETIGKPLPFADLRIARDDGSIADIGESGEIQIKGPYCMTGYFNRPEATAEAFTTDGYLRTGDFGVEREDGNFSFVGRLKEMYKSGGYNIYPVEIELALAEHPSVHLAAVLPVPHPVFQEVGHAFIATTDPALDEAALKAFLRPRLANYKLPKSFSFAAELPLLPNSKVDKQALKARLAEQVAA